MKHLKTAFSAIVMASLMAVPAHADNDRDDFAEAVALLCGAGSAEEIGEDVLEAYMRLARHPLHLNDASPHRIASSGLLSPYQMASLTDYRSRHGDVLSFSELAAVNGFGERFADALRHFVILDSDSVPGMAGKDDGMDAELMMRSTVKGETGAGSSYGYGAKVRASYGERLSVAMTARRPYGAKASVVNGSLMLAGRKMKMVLGDFNARFGQGLVWRSGFALAGFGSVAAFSVNPTGLSPAWSYSSPGRGGGFSVSSGRLEVTAAAKTAGDRTVQPLLNTSIFLPGGQLGLTTTKEAVSMDTRFCTGRMDWFAEAAYAIAARVPALIAGAVFNPEYQHRLGIRFRYYPSIYKVSTASAAGATTRSSDEIGATVGYETASLTSTLDIMQKPSDGTRQYRAILSYNMQSDGPYTLSLRAVERFKPEADIPSRTDLRTQFGYNMGGWQHALRLNALVCRNTGYLGYYEAGLGNAGRSGRTELKAFGRLTLFSIGHWDDRIYVYERDAPGNFSSRAFCGEGWNLQFFAGATRRTRDWSRFSIYMKAAVQDCTRENPHDRRIVELCLQAMARF